MNTIRLLAARTLRLVAALGAWAANRADRLDPPPPVKPDEGGPGGVRPK